MYSHSVTLEGKKCIGCTDCIKRCPTEAIRVKSSKAKIIEERCIDCGNCIAVCRNGAKKAVMDKLEMILTYPHKIALPAPSFYAQFTKAENIESILGALVEIGFTDVFEVAAAAEMVASYTREYVLDAKEYPVISSACPVIVRLIQRRFPSLINNILPIMSPMELAARGIKSDYKKRGIAKEAVGVFFISPCPAKATDIHRPKGFQSSYVDGAFSMQEIYKAILPKINNRQGYLIERQGTSQGLSWATRNGASQNIGISNHISVDGMENVISILEKVEDGTLGNIQYIEALACTGGCLGGALTIENPFVSRYTLKRLIEQEAQQDLINLKQVDRWFENIPYHFQIPIHPRPVFSLNQDIETALGMMEHIEKLYASLPQIDCGSCGAPTCKCFAEDVVRGFSHIEDCIFMLRKRIKELSESMLELTQKVLPTEEDEEG